MLGVGAREPLLRCVCGPKGRCTALFADIAVVVGRGSELAWLLDVCGAFVRHNMTPPQGRLALLRLSVRALVVQSGLACMYNPRDQLQAA